MTNRLKQIGDTDIVPEAGVISTQSLLAGWGNYPRALCHCVEPQVCPATLAPFADFQFVIPRGMGRSYGDASLAPEGSLVVGTRWYNKFVHFDRDEGVISAQAGVSLGEIVDLVIPAGWFLPVSPGTRHISLGGALASNIHGKNHHRSGSIVNFVESLTVLTEMGPLDCGPQNRVDLFRASIGGYGLTGVISQARLRLKRIETAWIAARLIKVMDFDAGLAVGEALDPKYEYSVTWLDCLARGRHLGRGIVMLGNHALATELPANRARQPLNNQWRKTLSAPRHFPGWMMNQFTNRQFNFAYFHRFWGQECETLLDLEAWFYPLDRVAHWNRVYGKAGFVEYQCALPKGTAAAGMKALLELVQRRGLGSFLAVWKRIGHDGVTLPFATPGYTLALDFGMRHPALLDILNEMDAVVIRHGGRVYLSKDARLSPGAFREMYPEYPQWREVVANYVPNRRFQSRLSQRLKL